MEILSAIVQMLGGLAMFLYGIEVMGDGLKNSSGDALKRVLEKVSGNLITGVLTGALVTAVIQSSTATIVLAVALIGAGVLTLKQAVAIVMGANIGTTITAWITNLAFMEGGGNFFLWLFDTDTLAPLALFLGIVLIMFIKSKKAKTGFTEVDLIPLIKSWNVEGRRDTLVIDVVLAARNPGLNPELIRAAFSEEFPDFAPDFVSFHRKKALDAEGEIFL